MSAILDRTSVRRDEFTHEDRGNLTSDGTRTFAFDLHNRLISAFQSGVLDLELSYDPLGRLRQVDTGAGVTQFLYDGDALVMEYNGANAIQRRYAHGAGVDSPLIWYEGDGLGAEIWLYADERGSIVAEAYDGGTAAAYVYDAFGQPDAWSGSRFRYTGQIALNDDLDARLYHYKARIYDPALGRFLQTDPTLYAGGMNLY